MKYFIFSDVHGYYSMLMDRLNKLGYDLNNDNYLSEYELELFAKAHPRFINDKQFVAWVESQLD